MFEDLVCRIVSLLVTVGVQMLQLTVAMLEDVVVVALLLSSLLLRLPKAIILRTSSPWEFIPM